MTIHQMYVENGNCAGFWVQHRGWRDICAQVQCIADCVSGELRGDASELGGASVIAFGFDLSSGRRVSLPPCPQTREDRNYRRIAVPPWSRRFARPTPSTRNEKYAG